MRNQFLTFTVIMMLAGNVHAGQTTQSGIWLASSSMTEIKLPTAGDITSLQLDFEYPTNIFLKAFAMDFNGDGVSDYIVEAYQSLCGTGGCSYAMVDGKLNKRIGDFFGSPILVLDQKINGYPIIQSYAHLNADSGNFVTYVFDGKKYQIVANTFVEGKSLEVLFKKLSAFRKVSASTPKAGS